MSITATTSPTGPTEAGGGSPAACTTVACLCKSTASISKIHVRVKATRALVARAGTAAPQDHVFDCTATAEEFPSAVSLVMIHGNMQTIFMKATVGSPTTPIWWDVRRAPDDHASLGDAASLPTLTVDGADPTKATLKCDSKGSFFVRVFADCNNNQIFEEGSPFRLLPFVLVDVKLHADNTVASNAGYTATVAGGTLNYSSGSFDINAVRAGTANAAVYMNAVVDVTSGGPNGRRLLECVFAGWINNLRSWSRWGAYSGGHRSELVLATNLAASTGGGNQFRPGDPAPVMAALPILDSGRNPHGTGGESATMTRSRVLPADKLNRAVGQRWRVENVDSPGGGEGGVHPFFPGTTLNHVNHRDNFAACLAFWTNRSKVPGPTTDPANRVYAVVRRFLWTVGGEWTIGPGPGFALTVVTAPAASTSASSTLSPASEAHLVNREVRTPNAFDVMGTDART